ncbi:MAG: metal-dependent transcriptional regulator [Butyricicoccaceae bacterium]
MKIQESGENYLETILLLERRNGVVRSIDIANELGFSKPSVSRAMGVLKKAGYVEQEAYGTISLTEAGRERAEAVYERHTLITAFLNEVLDVDDDIAEHDACRIEHIVSAQTVERMRSALKAHRKEK